MVTLFHDMAIYLLVLLFNVLLYVLLLWDTKSRGKHFLCSQKKGINHEEREGKEEGSFWGEINVLEWIVQDCLLWEGPHAEQGKSVRTPPLVDKRGAETTCDELITTCAPCAC